MKPSDRIKQIAELAPADMVPIYSERVTAGILAYLDELQLHTAATAALEPQQRPPCECLACDPPQTLGRLMRVCEICNNKRCPHADNHRNVCNRSNELDQPAFTWREHTDALVAQLTESREALARVEAERDELKRKLALYSAVVGAAEDVTCPGYEGADWYEPLAAALAAALPLEAASEAEVGAPVIPDSSVEAQHVRDVLLRGLREGQRCVVVGSTWKSKPHCCMYGERKVARIDVENGGQFVHLEGAAGVWTTPHFFDEWQWVSDPEATESATKERPACSVCNDTRMVDLGESRRVNCTSCPVPCAKCRAGGVGAYCEHPRCACDCHAG